MRFLLHLNVFKIPVFQAGTLLEQTKISGKKNLVIHNSK